ncbi:hypothetical protein F4561_004906 [Lipingzhangella halophila]|uniref:Adenosylmethionine-8-amino-7-oxononanoate aminotransferase n=1 Tax=Lipingzhangella halophila TaxID=1783352 RepID=A0A7W7RLD4_9ACTN|nr:daptide-type RiPP biosynthesis aminotransferase [Lipingzhangella halophila]MBB4934086.1 hypothetical protein [Lipingzhangella halophila]
MTTEQQGLWPYLVEPAAPDETAPCAVAAHGNRVRFASGEELLCGTSGMWNANLGYGNTTIADAVADALRTASYLSVYRYKNQYAQRAARALIEVCGVQHYGRVLFSTSGGAVNDAVMKLARQWQILQGRPERSVVVGLRGSYHGLTYGGFALTGEDLGQRAYGVDQRTVRHVEPNDTEQLRALFRRQGGRVAAVVVEPVLGTGALPLTDEYVEELLRLRDEHGFLLVADEVATGFGRTGEMFASQSWSRSPDMLLLSKGLTNGTCAAAVLVASIPVAGAFDRAGAVLSHAETQGGTPASCAAILATLDEMRRLDAVANAAKLSQRLDTELADPGAVHPWITHTRGRGCFRGLAVGLPGGEDLPQHLVPELLTAVRECGAIVHPGPSGFQIVPALTYTEAELDELLDCVRRGVALFAERWAEL